MAPDTSTGALFDARRRRSRGVIDAALAAVVAVWLVALVVVLVRRGDRDVEAPAAAEVPPRTELPPAGEILDQLEVETGFTPGEVVRCIAAGGQATGSDPTAGRCAPEDRRLDGEAVAYAIVVENTSDFVVRNLQLSYRFVDASGAAVHEADRHDDEVPEAEDASIPEIRAGESFAVGSTIYLESSIDVAEIEVELNGIDDWLPVDYYERTGEARIYAGDLDVTGIGVGYGLLNEPVVTFTVESGRSEPTETSLYAYVVFRDTDGAIIGGTRVLGGDSGPVSIPAGGSIEREVDGPMEIPGIDPSRTEVYLSPSDVL